MERWLSLARRVRQTVGGERFWDGVRPAYWRVVEGLTWGRGVAMRLSDGERYWLVARLYASEPHRYEPAVVKALHQVIREDSVVYDIGAHVGLITLMMARRLDPARGRVYAFEPSPVNLARLHQHVRRNRMSDRVTIVGSLAGERSMSAVEFSYMPSNSTTNSLAYAPPGSCRMTLPMVAIDDLIENGTVPPPDVVKIDVEGYERAVLQGASRWLQAASPTIVCALHPEQLALLGASTDAVIADMRGLGYATFDLSGREIQAAGFGEVIFRRACR